MNEVPEYRGYANLGTGQYLLNISEKGDPPELIISIASEQEKSGRTVGDLRDNAPGAIVQPEEMAVRLRFQNVAGLDALEQHLKFLRDEHFTTIKLEAAGALEAQAAEITALRAFHSFFVNKGESLFASFGMDAIDLLNKAAMGKTRNVTPTEDAILRRSAVRGATIVSKGRLAAMGKP